MTKARGTPRGKIPIRALSASDISLTEEASFWSLVDMNFLPGSCWSWKGHSGGGYGRFKVAGGRSAASRVAYALAWGYVPTDAFVCHKCDNPNCVRPEHLFLGSAGDNSDDKVRKGRQPSGSSVGTAILTEAQVADVFRRIMAGESRGAIAKHFGVAKRTVQKITLGHNWKHLRAQLGIEALRGQRRNPKRLNDEAVRVIRSAPHSKGVGRRLAKQFGVSEAMISQVRRGKAWTGVAV